MVSRYALLIPSLLATTLAFGATRIGSWTVVQSSADPWTDATVDVPANADLMVLADCKYDTGAPAATAVTLDGDNLTTETRVAVDTGEQTGIYTIEDDEGLAVGDNQTLIFNHAGAIDEGAHFFYAFFQNVDTAGTAVASLGSAVNGSNDATINTPTAGTINTGDIAVGVGCVFGSDGVTLTGEVLDDTVFNGNDGAVGEITATGAAVFTVTTGDFPGVSGIIIRNAVGGGGSAVPKIVQQHEH